MARKVYRKDFTIGSINYFIESWYNPSLKLWTTLCYRATSRDAAPVELGDCQYGMKSDVPTNEAYVRTFAEAHAAEFSA